MKTRIAERGQVTIPKPLRDKLGLRPGAQLDFSVEGGGQTGGGPGRRRRRRGPDHRLSQDEQDDGRFSGRGSGQGVITAVDTNVLLDVFRNDPRFCSSSAALIACDIVWAETAAAFPAQAPFLKAMQTLDVKYSTLGQRNAEYAAHAWRRYRAHGGKRDRVLADFLIGAHALQQADQLLTRDRGFYRPYFKDLRILDPVVT